MNEHNGQQKAEPEAPEKGLNFCSNIKHSHFSSTLRMTGKKEN